YPPSLYAEMADLPPPLPPLEGEARTDVAIVGGGYTGLSAALHLARAGFDVTLLEANRLGWDASGRNGGQVGTGQRRDQDWLEERLGRDRAHMLWDLGLEANRLVRRLVADYAIACDLQDGVVHAAHRPEHAAEHAAYAEKLARDYGYALAEPLDRDAVANQLGTDVYHGGFLDRGAAHLDPLAYALGLARAARAAGVRLHEGS